MNKYFNGIQYYVINSFSNTRKKKSRQIKNRSVNSIFGNVTVYNAIYLIVGT